MPVSTKSGFRTMKGSGFWITFQNGLTVSVQFGPGNYCETRSRWDLVPSYADPAPDIPPSEDAEIAIFDRDGAWRTREFAPKCGDDVIGWQSPEQVLKALIWAAAQDK